MKSLIDINIEKSRSGVYKDNPENRRLHRVGQRYGEPKKEDSSNGAFSLPTKGDLESSKDGSSIVIENVQTGNVVISYFKRGGKWFSRHAMTRGEVETNPEMMFRTLQGYNRKTYSIKPDLNVEESVSDMKDLKRDKKEAEERRNLEETKKTNEKVNEIIKQSEMGGKFSRVSLSDIPNAHKVNLTKYLSAKRKKAVDDAWDKAKFDSLPREKAGVFQEGYNKLREQFNNNFDSMSKSERAELLYKILKMKNAMERK